MLTHYLEFRTLPDPELATAVVMSSLFARVHRALAMQSCTRVGLSFPKAVQGPGGLGSVLRMYGQATELAAIAASVLDGGWSDYAEVSAVAGVPAGCSYRRVRRVQPKSNVARLRRRWLRRHQKTEAEAKLAFPDSVEQRVTLPFLQLRSASTGQRFRLFIQQDPPQAHPVPGVFNAYGLSTTATVPCF